MFPCIIREDIYVKAYTYTLRTNDITWHDVDRQRMMRPGFPGLALACASIFAGQALASSSGPGQIANPTMTNSNVTYFSQMGTRTTSPACATDPRYVIDPSVSGAATMNAALLTASVTGRQVTIQGTGFCLSGSTNETVAWIVLVN